MSRTVEMMGLFDDVRSWFARQDNSVQDVLSNAAKRLVFGGQTEKELETAQAKEKLMKQVMIGGAAVSVIVIAAVVAAKAK